MTTKICLNKKWDLFYFKTEPAFTDVSEIEKLAENKITANIPENFEISLANAGIIDKDLYKGMTTRDNQKFEGYDWWYKTEFSAPEIKKNEKLFLNFEGVDCIAEYYLNGKNVSYSDNALIPHRFEITDYIEQNNILYVHIKSAMRYAFEQEYNQFLSLTCQQGFQAYLRKSAHSFGWDIFPRAISGGIWRDVNLEIENEYKVEELSYFVKEINKKSANIVFTTVFDVPYDEMQRAVVLKVKGVCGDSEFFHEHYVSGCKVLRFDLWVDNPKLWWPYGYGEPNIYDLTYELYVDGELKDQGSMNLGIRIAELKRTETMLEKDHRFKFVINGVDVMCCGSNWVPLDAYHSRDKEKYQKALSLFTEANCNMVRVWGGGVYEQEEFYNYCDRNGLMVWQDFCVACCGLPYDQMYSAIEKEAIYIVKALRHHPSLVVWSGDNEVDEILAINKRPTDMNRFTRELYPRIINMHDTMRSYLQSSPYLAPAEAKNYTYENTPDVFPERHLWGARDYYKADFYAKSKAHFVSETGYHGCPSVKSVKKTVDENAVWPIYNEQWSLHSSNQFGGLDRVQLMDDQIVQLFGKKMDNIEDFSIASQISQAEAVKFMIERIRINKPYTGGIIWWNMVDGWPQMSDAVVDYFYEKKLAFDYIKRSQQPLCLMIDEMKDWNYTLVATNDTLKPQSGKYKVYDVLNKKTYAEGEFTVEANQNEILTKIRMMYTDKAFLVIAWEIDGKKYYNHYLCGFPEFDFSTYKNWLKEFNKQITE